MRELSEENLYTPNSVRAISGNYIDFLNPDPLSITLNDIAVGLSCAYRFCGHMQTKITVADHSIRVSKIVYNKTKDKELALIGLLHDATEAYMSDIPGPLKKLCPNIVEIEDRLYKCIMTKFHLPLDMPDIVKYADKESLRYEWDNFVIRDEIYKYGSRSHSDIVMEFITEYVKLI